MPHRRHTLGQLAALGLLATSLRPSSTRANPARFPDRPLTLVLPFAPGGVADLTARAVAEQLARGLGQAVVVDNRPGAGAVVASQTVAAARPDGHTLLLVSNGHAVSTGLYRRLPYDVQKDFAPIGLMGWFDLGVFVAPGSPLRQLRELIAAARATPGRLTVGTIIQGSTQQLAAKLFETQAGVDFNLIPYKASPAVLTALRSGEIDAAIEITGPWLGQLKSGAIRALAVTSGHRNPVLPEVPTAIEAGLAGYDVASWNALAVPAATPADIQARLAQALREALAQPALRERLASQGVRVESAGPAETQALLSREIRRWGDVIRRAGIEPE
ncbi:MAG: hypothetical protein RL223_2776 [Pseudomonadota bacterium]